MATADTRVLDSDVTQSTTKFATSADANPLSKLIQHQQQEVDKAKDKLKQLTKYKENYEALRERLETLPDKVSHQVMVPFGKVAFIPGRLRHTNEILCLLGDDWFVERSAKQAAQIVDRRLAACRKTIEQFQGQIKLTQDRIGHTLEYHEEVKDRVSIAEYEEDDSWREEHRRKVKEYKQKMAEMKKLEAASDSREAPSTEEDLLRRLDELELMEELQDELAMLDMEDDDEVSSLEEEESVKVNNTSQPGRKKKSVRWSQSPDAIKQFRRDELIAGPTSQCEPVGDDKDQDTTMKITFKHSPDSKKKSARFASVDSRDPSSSVVVSNPSEIFRKFSSSETSEKTSAAGAAAEPKSILKVKKSTTPVIEIVQRPDTGPADPPPPLAQQQQTTSAAAASAVGDEVKERGETVADAPASESVNTHRPVSRFRAARMNKKL